MHERERWQVIGAMLRDKPVVTVREIVAATRASTATVRRDLMQLEEAGQLRRVHGGVEAVPGGAAAAGAALRDLATRGFSDSQGLNLPRKRAIARAAVALCADGESIIVNAGSTTYEMVEPLEGRQLSILTNSFPMAQALLARTENRVILPGGEVYRKQGIVISPFDDDAIQHYTASTMFMSCYSLGPMGVIEGDPLIARAEAKLLRRADRLVVLVDSSKFERRGAIAVCPLSRIHTVVTDDAAPEATLEMLRGMGIRVIVVPADATDARAA